MRSGRAAFFGQQPDAVAAGALVGDADGRGRGAGALGVAAEHRGHHLQVVVEARGGAVHGAEERARPATADEPQAAPRPGWSCSALPPDPMARRSRSVVASGVRLHYKAETRARPGNCRARFAE